MSDGAPTTKRNGQWAAIVHFDHPQEAGGGSGQADFTFGHGDLVSDGYMRQIPVDPITNTADSWKLIMEDAANTVNQSQPGIFDIRSGSDKISLEGTPYSEW